MKIVIIDFEAEKDQSGHYFPTEIGLCKPGGRPISALICPQRDWHVDERTLFNRELWLSAREDGRSVDFIVGRFPSLVRDCQLVSDAAFFDQRLMARMGLEDRLIEFFPLAERLVRENSVPMTDMNRWINEIDSRRTTQHRAAEDAWVRAELISKIVSKAR